VKLPLYQVDAFSSRPFGGNPAAVCPLDEWLPDEVMQAIAAENNLAETAFFVEESDGYRLRWFTPIVEVDLCGHATLASGYVVLTHLDSGRESVTFHTRSGPLVVQRHGDLFQLDLPALPPKPLDPSEEVARALGKVPVALLAARELMAVLESEEEVKALQPNMDAVAKLDTFALMVTAPGREVDFVSRFFAPAQGIPEDPVTGSAHCTLVPYWAERLGKNKLSARQVSPRVGELDCELAGDRVMLRGGVAPYLSGMIHLAD
jgi:PhzF family phenazine biosynthesis protein